MTRTHVRVVPRSKSPGPDGRRGGVPVVRVAAPPADGRANAELERMLTKVLGARTRVVGGGASRLKTVEVSLEPAALDARLRSVFGDDRNTPAL